MLIVYKPVGFTPFEVVKWFQRSLRKTKIGYAGRLDPMAEGVLMLLVDEENKCKKIYEGLDKVYRFDIVFGISTDTHDTLGILQSVDFSKKLKILNLQNVLKKFQGEYLQQYPAYSAVRVDGRPLYYWARRGVIQDMEIPTKKRSINNVQLVNTRLYRLGSLRRYIIERIRRVRGDFRQKDIVNNWKTLFSERPNIKVNVATIQLHCSSGTYVRKLTEDIGKSLSTNTTTLSIQRLAVGRYDWRSALCIPLHLQTR